MLTSLLHSTQLLPQRLLEQLPLLGDFVVDVLALPDLLVQELLELLELGLAPLVLLVQVQRDGVVEARGVVGGLDGDGLVVRGGGVVEVVEPRERDGEVPEGGRLRLG
jgi:hypothetical protein